MPRERGLNYTPDADGYSFEDTAIGEAAQASFHRLASGYPQQEPDQQEPDDIHHLADVITGIRDSTFCITAARRRSRPPKARRQNENRRCKAISPTGIQSNSRATGDWFSDDSRNRPWPTHG